MKKIWVAMISKSGAIARPLVTSEEQEDVLLFIRRHILKEVGDRQGEGATQIRDRLSRSGAGDVLNACQLYAEHFKVEISFGETDIVNYTDDVHEAWEEVFRFAKSA